MRKSVALTGACAVMLGAALGPARAQESPTSYVCDFTGGAAWSYTAGAFQSKPPQPLSFTIEEIDLDKQTAVLKPKSGADRPGKLTVVRAINANHFIEAVNEGFLNITTVYDKDPATGLYPAVHSRHFGILGQPVFGQYTGACHPG
jgi:hypothetical protein